MSDGNVKFEGAKGTPAAVQVGKGAEATKPEGPTSRLISEGVVLLIGTALAYLGTFLYELGYSRHFGYPSEFIALNIQTLLIFGFGGFVALATFLQWLTVSYVWLERVPKNYLTSIVWPIAKIYLIFLCLMEVMLIIMNTNIIIVLITHFCVVLAIWGTFLEVKKSGKPGQSYGEVLAWWASVQSHPRQSQRGLAGLINMYSKSVSLALIIMLGLALCLLLGSKEAAFKDVYPMVGQVRNEVVLRRYGDSFVLARFDSRRQLILREYRLVPAAELKEPMVIRKLPKVRVDEVRE